MTNQLFNVLIGNGIANITVLYESKKKLRLIVKKEKESIYYDVNSDLVIPLTFGNGIYEFILCEHKSGNIYTNKQRIVRTVGMPDTEAYRLQSNSYIKYSNASSFYRQARALKTWDAIKKFFERNFLYDYVGAIFASRQKFGPSDLEKCWLKKKGTCYNLSALLVAMLRICEVPARLVVGKVDRKNHAWVEVNGKIYDPTKELQGSKKELKYIAERYY